jgi:hypothetical protein
VKDISDPAISNRLLTGYTDTNREFVAQARTQAH